VIVDATDFAADSVEVDRELTADEIKALRSLDLSSCDFVGDSGCVDPECWRCHSPLRSENLRTLAENLAIAALLYRAWHLRDTCPTWTPGCGELPMGLTPLMKAAIASPHVGVFLRRSR